MDKECEDELKHNGRAYFLMSKVIEEDIFATAASKQQRSRSSLSRASVTGLTPSMLQENPAKRRCLVDVSMSVPASPCLSASNSALPSPQRSLGSLSPPPAHQPLPLPSPSSSSPSPSWHHSHHHNHQHHHHHHATSSAGCDTACASHRRHVDPNISTECNANGASHKRNYSSATKSLHSLTIEDVPCTLSPSQQGFLCEIAKMREGLVQMRASDPVLHTAGALAATHHNCFRLRDYCKVPWR